MWFRPNPENWNVNYTHFEAKDAEEEKENGENVDKEQESMTALEDNIYY